MWYTNTGKNGDIVLSSRVRLARNIKDIPFAGKMTEKDELTVLEKLKPVAEKNGMNFFSLKNFPLYEKQALAEQHIISPDMLDNSRQRGLIISPDNRTSIMLCEEDHIRIQCMQEGFNLEECLKNAVEIDNLIENEIDYEFHQDLGYLTCCPSNLGTGMRASVMVHLPAHTKTGKINSVIRNFSQVGLTVRGLYGEGSKALGNIYQVSNQVTLGLTEEEIIEKLTGFITELTENERKLQKELYDREKFVLEDKIMRSYGTLKNAVILSSSETLNLISDMRLGINLGIIKDISLGTLNEIFYAVLPANIIKKYNLESSAERDLKRAEIIKEKLK